MRPVSNGHGDGRLFVTALVAEIGEWRLKDSVARFRDCRSQAATDGLKLFLRKRSRSSRQFYRRPVKTYASCL